MLSKLLHAFKGRPRSDLRAACPKAHKMSITTSNVRDVQYVHNVLSVRLLNLHLYIRLRVHGTLHSDSRVVIRTLQTSRACRTSGHFGAPSMYTGGGCRPCVASAPDRWINCVRPNVNLSSPCGNSATAALNLCESCTGSWCLSRGRPPFGANRPAEVSDEFDLKQETAQLFEFVRSVEAGEIRVLEVRGGLPFTMESPWQIAND